jgi:very-long-chain (3R)-3-hydroxyacyl-CoA dehydratase
MLMMYRLVWFGFNNDLYPHTTHTHTRIACCLLLVACCLVLVAYLFLYNIVACAGWAYLLYLTVTSFQNGLTPQEFWQVVEVPLKVVQTLALLEVVHAVLRIVPSQVMATLMQVSSRLIVLWGIMNASADSRAHWSLYLTVASWSLVEVPRYLFYALNLYVADVPLPLLQLRYSLFIILYPSGISGMTQ